MKKIVETLGQKNIIFKSLRQIDPIELGSKKKIAIYLGTLVDNYYGIVLSVERKSRILTKDTLSYNDLHQKAQEYNDSKINKKYILIDAPLCSKAKAKLQEEGWSLFHLE
ncbi:MAG: hypothetical protein U9N49_01860, partial [Campylobacterota bacterium]|nr:hypothetical protein [Campylobacterota bacterium]